MNFIIQNFYSMMRQIFFIVVFMCGVQVARANQNLSIAHRTLSDGVQSTMPYRDVESEPGSVSVTYTFENVSVINDPVFIGQKIVRIDGFGLLDEPGLPSIVCRKDFLTVPGAMSPTLTIDSIAFEDFRMTLSPARPPLINSSNEFYSKRLVITK